MSKPNDANYQLTGTLILLINRGWGVKKDARVQFVCLSTERIRVLLTF